MALTAARTELNVSLVGEDETIRMIEDAKKRMADLEAKTRSLTGATKAQTEAAEAQTTALAATNETLVGAAKKAEGVVEGVDKVKGAFEKVVGVIGFVSVAVTGAIAAFEYLREAFTDSEKEAAALTKSLKAQEAALAETKKATEELAAIQQKSIEGQRTAAIGLIQEKIRLAELEKNTAAAAELRSQLEQETQKNRINELREQVALKTQEQVKAANEISEAQSRINDNQRYVDEKRAEVEQLRLDIAKRRLEVESSLTDVGEAGAGVAIANASDIEDKEARILRIKTEIDAITNSTLKPERERLRIAQATLTDILKQKSALNGLMSVAEQVANALKSVTGAATEEEKAVDKPAKPRGGGGGGRRKTKEEIAREEREKAYERFKIIRDLNEEEASIEETKQRALAKAALGDEVLESQKKMKERILRELASLPTDATSKAFDPLRVELQKQLTEIEKVTAQHAEMGFWGLPDYFDADIVNKVLDSWDAEAQGIAKVDDALTQLGQTRLKAIEESEKMREAMFRAMPAEVVQAFAVGLEQLAEMQAPVFEVVQESLAGLTSQMGKFKDGQTSLAAAIVGSASAIAGSVAKKVLGVKEEAGIRALFETAMGIATAFTNPAESVGHFAAATAFGLVAGGKVASSDARASSGQKAPAKPAAQTRDSTMGGGGGQITNVYNLQTGIVDGQSTAHAFRRAEMTARNTGMASAGGW